MKINSPEWLGILKNRAATGDIKLTEKKIALLGTFAAELVAWNRKVNLTAITEPMEVIEKHLIDSLIPARHFREGVSMFSRKL